MLDDSGGAGPQLTLRVGPVEIRLREEPLETIVKTTPLDAIVSSDDSALSMGGGVSAVVARLAGTSIRDEVDFSGPLPVGSLAITSGGALPVRHIFHAVTVDWVNEILPTERTIRQLLREILSRCEALRIERIAIPALATGAAGLSPTVSATIIARALHAHALNPTVLRCVVLPIPDAPVRQAFARELAMPLLEEITAVPPSSVTDGKAGRAVVEYELARLAEDEKSAHDAPQRKAPPGGARGSLSRFRGRLRNLKRGRTATDPVVGDSVPPPTSPLEEATTSPISLASSTSTRPLLNNRYVLLEEVGRGGMAIVLLSWDLVLRRTVAIKVLRPELAESESLMREASVALALTHQRIVRVYHFEPGSPEDAAFMVMEYLPWPSGEKWIADAGASLLPVRSVVNVILGICDALAYAHSQSVLHLDIKPSNIFVDAGGEDAKLGDFGLSRESSTRGDVLLLKAAGTPAYMAPEQRVRGASLNQATDVYQLAATMWDLLTGGPPRPEEPDLSRVEPDRFRLLTALDRVLRLDQADRPSVRQLRGIVESAA